MAHRFSDGGLKHATTFKRPKLECLDLKSAVDKTTLNQLLEMSDKERSCINTRVEGRVTWLSDFKKRFEAKMGKGTYVADPTVFAGLGFRLSETRVNVCKTCKQLARPQILSHLLECWARSSFAPSFLQHGGDVIK